MSDAITQPRMLTIAGAAARLDCHPETLRRAIRAGTLACYRFGGAVRISPDHLQAYLDASLCPARDPQVHILSSDADVGTSSGGKTTPESEYRRERQMNRALDKTSRILRTA